MRPPRIAGALSTLALLLVLGLPAACSPTPKATPLPPNSVVVANFAFSPSQLTVPIGTTVTWGFRQPDAPHNVVALDPAGAFSSGAPKGSGEYTFTFTKAGTYTYICQVHPSMRGTVVVTP